MDAFSERRAVLDNHVGATVRLAERVENDETTAPDFVLWPENSTDIDPFEDPTVHADIQAAVDAVGVPVLVGAMVRGPGAVDVRNQGIVWHPGTGPGASYSKTHPVPFGEYIPHRAQLARLFQRLDQIPRDMVPGSEPGVLDIAGTTVGDVICFEVAYDGVVHDVVEGGAELLVVQTNNATYMGTGQVEQQFAIARLRAVETGRYLVVVATNGVSGIIAPDGSVVTRAPVRETVVMEEDVPLRSGMTPGVRLGPWVERGLSAVALLALVVAVVRQRRSSAGHGGTDATPAPRPAGSQDPAVAGGAR
jgi:apolipoprotein N-acyltransferase